MENEQFKIHEAEKPFTIVERNKKEFIITIGNNVVSEKTFKTLKAAKEYIESKPYTLTINAACLIYSLTKEDKK